LLGDGTAFLAPNPNVLKRALFVKFAGSGSEFWRDPTGIYDLLTDVSAGSSVLLMNLREVLAGKSPPFSCGLA
jgi:hypothetical protein